MTPHPSSSTQPSVQSLGATHFPSMQAEHKGLVAQIGSRSRKTQAMLALANFDAKAKKATSYVNIGHQMLRDAHQAAIHTLQTILHDEVHGSNKEYQHNQAHAGDAGTVKKIAHCDHTYFLSLKISYYMLRYVCR